MRNRDFPIDLKSIVAENLSSRNLAAFENAVIIAPFSLIGGGFLGTPFRKTTRLPLAVIVGIGVLASANCSLAQRAKASMGEHLWSNGRRG